jgi:hypothetical protein
MTLLKKKGAGTLLVDDKLLFFFNFFLTYGITALVILETFNKVFDDHYCYISKNFL